MLITRSIVLPLIVACEEIVSLFKSNIYEPKKIVHATIYCLRLRYIYVHSGIS